MSRFDFKEAFYELALFICKTILILCHLWQFIGDSGLIIGEIANFSADCSAKAAAILAKGLLPPGLP